MSLLLWKSDILFACIMLFTLDKSYKKGSKISCTIDFGSMLVNIEKKGHSYIGKFFELILEVMQNNMPSVHSVGGATK